MWSVIVPLVERAIQTTLRAADLVEMNWHSVPSQTVSDDWLNSCCSFVALLLWTIPTLHFSREGVDSCGMNIHESHPALQVSSVLSHAHTCASKLHPMLHFNFQLENFSWLMFSWYVMPSECCSQEAASLCRAAISDSQSGLSIRTWSVFTAAFVSCWTTRLDQTTQS